MTIKDLRNIFITGTQIDICTMEYDDLVSLTLNNLLIGTESFANIPIQIRNVQAVAENHIVVSIDIPATILRAWKTYLQEANNA